MIRALKLWIIRYGTENFHDLLAFDLKLARMLGAPAPHTLSSWAYYRKDVSAFWCLFRKITDKLAYWLLKQVDHCQKDYQRVINGDAKR